jgi:hypothetical protein
MHMVFIISSLTFLNQQGTFPYLLNANVKVLTVFCVFVGNFILCGIFHKFN